MFSDGFFPKYNTTGCCEFNIIKLIISLREEYYITTIFAHENFHDVWNWMLMTDTCTNDDIKEHRESPTSSTRNKKHKRDHRIN